MYQFNLFEKYINCNDNHVKIQSTLNEMTHQILFTKDRKFKGL